MPSLHPRAAQVVRLVALLGLGVALAGHFWVLYVPQLPGPSPFPGADKVVHALLFAAPAFLALLAGLPARGSVAALSVHAPVSELIQHLFLTQRAGDLRDVLADLVGLAIGVAAARAVTRAVGARALVRSRGPLIDSAGSVGSRRQP